MAIEASRQSHRPSTALDATVKIATNDFNRKLAALKREDASGSFVPVAFEADIPGKEENARQWKKRLDGRLGPGWDQDWDRAWKLTGDDRKLEKLHEQRVEAREAREVRDAREAVKRGHFIGRRRELNPRTVTTPKEDDDRKLEELHEQRVETRVAREARQIREAAASMRHRELGMAVPKEDYDRNLEKLHEQRVEARVAREAREPLTRRRRHFFTRRRGLGPRTVATPVEPRLLQHGAGVLVVLLAILAAVTHLPRSLICWISLALLCVAYMLSRQEDLRPPQGSRIPHGHWSTSASTVASAGFALLGLYVTQPVSQEEASFDPSAQSFEAYFFRRASRIHVSILSLAVMSWMTVIYRSKCLAETAGDLGGGAVMGVAARVGLHFLSDHELANRLSPVVGAVALIGTTAIAVVRLASNVSLQGHALCPGHVDPFQVADAWVTVLLQVPIFSLLNGAYHWVNGGGASIESKVGLTLLYLTAMTLLIIIYAAEHGTVMIASICYLWVASTVSYGSGAYFGHQVVRAELAIFESVQKSNASGKPKRGVRGRRKEEQQPGGRKSFKPSGVEPGEPGPLLQPLRARAEEAEAENVALKMEHLRLKKLTREVIDGMRVEEDRDQERYCVVCTENLSNILMLPCRHLKCCASCVIMLGRNGPLLCPMCRTRVADSVVVHI